MQLVFQFMLFSGDGEGSHMVVKFRVFGHILYVLAKSSYDCFYVVFPRIIHKMLHSSQEALAHPWCDLIYLTDIMADFDCDVFFPRFDQNVFRKQNK